MLSARRTWTDLVVLSGMCFVLASGDVIGQTLSPEATKETGRFTVEPAWVVTTDSDGNRRHTMRLEADVAGGEKARLGVAFGSTSVQNVSEAGEFLRPEMYRTMAVTGLWHATPVLSFEGRAGVAHTGTTLNEEEDVIGSRTIPTGRVMAHVAPADERLVVDIGFNRTLHDLSPQLVVNRVMRSEALIRASFVLADGLRIRGRSELGSMSGHGERNGRYNSELSLVGQTGANSELYATWSVLHYSKASDLGYYSPDQVRTTEGGWSTEIERRRFSLALDAAAGIGHARGHGETYGPWGLSLRTQCDVRWRFSSERQVFAGGEYYYNQFNPAVESSPQPGWSMTAVTFGFRWR